jgi:orotate phosphoribosyltransferase
MEALKSEFITFLLEAKALRFGDFTTKSGRKTPYFVNTGAFRTGGQLARLGEFYARTLHGAHGEAVDNLFGPAYKGIPLSVSTAAAYHQIFKRDLSYTFNRKETKDHGEGGLLVGFDYKDWSEAAPCRVVLIEDVTTAGTSIRETMPLILASGKAKAVGLVVAVDRREKGPDGRGALQGLRETYGMRADAVVDLRDIRAFLETKAGQAYIGSDPGLAARMDAYAAEYGVEE